MFSEPCHVLSFFVIRVLTGRITIYRKASFPIVKCPQTRAPVRSLHRALTRPNTAEPNALQASTTLADSWRTTTTRIAVGLWDRDASTVFPDGVATAILASGIASLTQGDLGHLPARSA
jgi:hypothetical protein